MTQNQHTYKPVAEWAFVSLDPLSVSQVIALHEPLRHRCRVEFVPYSVSYTARHLLDVRRASQSTTSYFRIRSAFMSNPEELVYERAVLGWQCVLLEPWQGQDNRATAVAK
ncbi:unnamed protein product [Ectocarpus sp. 12 AP-2014]